MDITRGTSALTLGRERCAAPCPRECVSAPMCPRGSRSLVPWGLGQLAVFSSYASLAGTYIITYIHFLSPASRPAAGGGDAPPTHTFCSKSGRCGRRQDVK